MITKAENIRTGSAGVDQTIVRMRYLAGSGRRGIVIIPLVVIDELDEKSYGSKDNGEKARGALRYVQLRRDRHGADEAVPLGVTLPEVTIQLLVDRPGHEPRSSRDQEFLEHARYVAALAEQKVVVVTTDYGMRLRATATDLEWCVIARRAGGRPDPSESSLMR